MFEFHVSGPDPVLFLGKTTDDNGDDGMSVSEIELILMIISWTDGVHIRSVQSVSAANSEFDEWLLYAFLHVTSDSSARKSRRTFSVSFYIPYAVPISFFLD